MKTSLSQRAVVWWLSLALSLLPLAGCETLRPYPTTVQLAAIVIDGVRLAQPSELNAVRVLRAGVALPVEPGMALQRGDRVETGRGAFAVVRWPSGSEVYLRPGSGAEIGSLTKALGEFFVKVRGLFAVETEFVRSGARGTAFSLRTGQGGEVTVTVFDGRVQVDSLQGLWAPVTLPAGTTALAHPRAPQPVPVSAAEMQQTRDWVERIERLVPAPSSGAVAGVALAIGALIGVILLNRGDRDRAPRPEQGSTTRNPQAPTPTPAAPPPAAPSPIR
ncbi:FecR family protein [uncultured Azohydromonas sp.]|jgi:Uncharacterized protein conserved in bacteria|uniref:FecR family protein n=1 Tax=uncultured Azohydromonas sp. TaxID=487342 RepID=UPI00260B729A|nr:FecR family protein [uncultured Azohydromonas sp.]